MKIFEFTWDAGGYGNGVMLVAANTREEAEKFARTESRHWHFDGERHDIAFIGNTNKPGIVLSQYYQE